MEYSMMIHTDFFGQKEEMEIKNFLAMIMFH
jgi:hypothetical protein